MLFPRRKKDKDPIKTKFKSIDKAIGGLVKGHTTIISAEDDDDRTYFALNIASNASNKENKRFLYIGVRKTTRCILNKLFEVNSDIGVNDIKNKRVEYKETKISEIKREIYFFKNCNVIGTDNPDYESIKTIILENIEKSNISVVFIDYLELMTFINRPFKSDDPKEDRSEELNQIVYRFKVLSRELNISIVPCAKFEYRRDAIEFGNLSRLHHEYYLINNTIAVIALCKKIKRIINGKRVLIPENQKLFRLFIHDNAFGRLGWADKLIFDKETCKFEKVL